jgi:DNA repair photolyase
MSNVPKCRAIYKPAGRAGEYSPLAVNLYTGCAHRCRYCYVPNCLKMDKEKFHSQIRIRKNIIDSIEHDVESTRIIEPVLLCFTCDPYTPYVEYDPDNFTTRKVMAILSGVNVNFQILTKSGLKAARDFDLYKAGDKFATTLTFFDPQKSQEIEPFAALPAERVESLRKAKGRNIETWVSLEPALDEKEIHKLIDASAEFTDLYKVGKVTNYRSDIIDWSGFVKRITAHLDSLRKPYFLKRDLRQYL